MMMTENIFYSDLGAALPVLKEINDLYYAGESLRQRMGMRRTNKKASYSKTAKIKAGLAATLMYMVLTFLLRIIITPIAAVLKLEMLPVLYSFAGVGVCIYTYIRLKKYFANMEPAESAEDISEKQQLEQISGEIYRLSQENDEILKKIPSDYRCYDAAAFMERALENGRAENKKEVINLYEEELHRKRLEANSAVSVRMQQEQCRMLADIENNSHRAAVNSGIAATFTVLSYLGRD